jgi:hypothetical protein
MLQEFASTHNVKMIQLDRWQQLQLRRHRADLRHQLPHLAVVVAQLLQRRQLGHENFTTTPHHQRKTNAVITGAINNIKTAMANAGLHHQPVHDRRADLPVADPQQLRFPLLAVGLHPPEHGRLRLLEQRRQLGQRHRAGEDQQRGEERCQPRPTPPAT